METISDFILSLLPGNNKFFYLYYLAFIFIFSLFLIFYFSRKVKKKPEKKETEITMKDLLKISSSSKSTTKDLLFAINYFAENFSVETDEKSSFAFFKKLLNHKNRQKVLFDVFHGNVLPKNLKYKLELNNIEKEALNNKVK